MNPPTAARTCVYNIPVKPHISVVEDDPDISRLVRHHLEGAGFSVKLYPAGNIILTDAERQRPTLFLLDIMVPGKDGLELCRQIRQTPALASIPVIFLTAKNSESDRVLGLELGADDYIPKPFSPRELVARVKAVLRRFERPLAPGPVRVVGIEIDPAAMTLHVEGKLVTTTATEFRNDLVCKISGRRRNVVQRNNHKVSCSGRGRNQWEELSGNHRSHIRKLSQALSPRKTRKTQGNRRYFPIRTMARNSL